MSQVVIVAGPPGSGKSTVCEALCERYDRTVHIETDEFYASLRMGYVPPWKPGSDRQNRLVSRAVARAASAYAQELYGVFIDGVIGPHLLPEYLDELRIAGVPVHYAVLLPSIDEMLLRAHTRDQIIPMPDDMYEPLHQMFSGDGLPGCRIDSTGMTADRTADALMAACGRGDCLVLSP